MVKEKNLGAGFKGAKNICAFPLFLKCGSIVKSIKLNSIIIQWLPIDMTKHIHKIGEECSSCK